MNRKMRAKLNNAAAKAKKESRLCSKRDMFLAQEADHCDECGEKLRPVGVILEEYLRAKETLH